MRTQYYTAASLDGFIAPTLSSGPERSKPGAAASSASFRPAARPGPQLQLDGHELLLQFGFASEYLNAIDSAVETPVKILQLLAARPEITLAEVAETFAEGIINNVRKTILRDRLTDPRFYDQMSKLLDDLIQQSRADTAAYEEFLRKAEVLVKRLAKKQPEAGVPSALHGKREAVVIYNNLPRILAVEQDRDSVIAESHPAYGNERVELALEIDRTIRERAPAGWKGDQAREAQVLNALFPLLNRDRKATLALFELVKNQPGY
ncbi:hypothetical protein W02_33340 [Nitrospira sp. KM1]|nr:hypothetical protein [Nitrospira sp. KM1]BCA56194.1 hypothetical protein W02_33340 [Nitrospira sp. KM1]